MDTEDFYVGRIADCDRIAARHPRLAQAFAFLKRPDLAALPPGRYDLDGDNLWATVQDVALKPFGDTQHAEIHHTYIDIQAPLSGPETIGLLALVPGDFAVLMPPCGAHAPGCSLDGARTVRKLIIKIRK